MHRLAVALLFVLLSVAAFSDSGNERQDEELRDRCRTFAATDVSAVVDAPTQILSTELIAAKGRIPAHCHVEGYTVPQVGVALRLPTIGWNGKILQVACAGFCGAISIDGGECN